MCTASHKDLCSTGVGPYKAPDEQSWRSAGFTQYLQNKDDEFCSSWELELSVSLVQGLLNSVCSCSCVYLPPQLLHGAPGDGAAAVKEPQEALRRDAKQSRVASDAVRTPAQAGSWPRAQAWQRELCFGHHCTTG